MVGGFGCSFKFVLGKEYVGCVENGDDGCDECGDDDGELNGGGVICVV